MKILIALALFAIGAHGLGNDQLTCTETTVSIAGTQADFPRYKGSEISLGSCPLGDDFSLSAGHKDCGLVQAIKGNLVTFSGVLASAAATGVITRRKPVKFSVTCIFDTASQQTAGAFIEPVLGELTGDLENKGDPVSLSLNLLDADGNVVEEGKSLKIDVGVNVDGQVSGANLNLLKMKAVIKTCYVTPSADPADSTKYTLIEDACPKDPTFSVSADGGNQKFSFESLAFTASPKAPVYLHCDLESCALDDAACGVCAAVKRKRRHTIIAITKHTINKMVFA